MLPSLRRLPPSRINKKQISAHLSGDLARLMAEYRHKWQLTSQEAIALAVNSFAYKHGRSAILKVARERLVRRKKGLAKAQSSEAVAASRVGRVRVAGWFDAQDVDQLNGYAIEIGIKVETIVINGFKIMLNGFAEKHSNISSASE